MLQESPIRIIYLKNNPLKLEPQQKQYSHITFINQPQSSPDNQRLINLVNLSAKIQHLSPNKSGDQHKIRKIIQKTTQDERIQLSTIKYDQMHPITEKSQLMSDEKAKIKSSNHTHHKINRNRQSRIISSKEKDNSIINILGSIEFRHAKKHKRTQKNISSIKNACISQRPNQTLSPKKQLNRNKPQLQNDFHNFLENKKCEESKLKLPMIQDKLLRIKKLATINPQKMPTTRTQKKLNLFNFLKYKQYQGDNVKTSGNMQIKSKDDFHLNQVLQILIDPSKVHQQFEWSKISNEHKNVSLPKDMDGNKSIL